MLPMPPCRSSIAESERSPDLSRGRRVMSAQEYGILHSRASRRAGRNVRQRAVVVQQPFSVLAIHVILVNPAAGPPPPRHPRQPSNHSTSSSSSTRATISTAIGITIPACLFSIVSPTPSPASPAFTPCTCASTCSQKKWNTNTLNHTVTNMWSHVNGGIGGLRSVELGGMVLKHTGLQHERKIFLFAFELNQDLFKKCEGSSGTLHAPPPSKSLLYREDLLHEGTHRGAEGLLYREDFWREGR